MKTRNRALAGIICLLMIVLCGLVFAACDSVCVHEWSEWTATTQPSCTEATVNQRTCSKCNEVETKSVSASGHIWADANCATPKTCKVCHITEGEALGHTWTDATCAAPKTCTVCQATEGTALSHTWADATCSAPKTCTTCQATEGDALGHTWADATCEAPKTCTTCQATDGDALGHTWVDATCETPKHCSVCNKIDVAAPGHTWTNATCEAPMTCTVCQKTQGEALGHTWADATCEAPKTCTVCQKTEGTALGHDWADATCEAPKTCSVCQKTDGNALGHDWADATCEAPKTCTVCQKTDGNALGHDWADATCTAPKTCTVCQATDGDALGHTYVYLSLGNGTHAVSCYVCRLEPTAEDCTGGQATCASRAVCDFCKTAYGPEPAHDWDEGKVTKEVTCLVDGEKTYTCSVCNGTKTEVIRAEGHNYESKVTAPTCIAQGYTEHICSKCQDTYTDTYVVANGHDWDYEEQTCAHGRECTVCQAKEEALHHQYVPFSSTEATCDEAPTETYKCYGCGDTHTTVSGSPLGHDTKDAEAKEVLKDGTTCEYVHYYECSRCHDDIEKEHVFRHEYIATVTTAPTCKNAGEKTLECKHCHDKIKQPVEIDTENGHSWIQGPVAAGSRTDTCKHCSTQKSVYVYEGNKTEATDTSNLKDVEIELDNANISLGDKVLENLGDQKVTVSAGKLEGDDRNTANIDPDLLNKIGDSPIFDFTIVGEDEKNFDNFSEDTWITVTIPYKLTQGEDVDSIAVWCLKENGEIESFPATYYPGGEDGTDGYIVFKTNHFSYYTVAKLTAEQRCALYQHNWSDTTVVEGDCLNDGYTFRICLRCHKTEKTVTHVAYGHAYDSETTNATCTEDGYIVYTCQNEGCDHSYTKTIPATGHVWKQTDSEEATCQHAGYITYTCENCGSTYNETLAQLSHKIETEVIGATCDTYGYVRSFCLTCDYSYNDSYTEPLGHDYVESWEWAEDYSKATLTLICKHNEEHTLSAEATIIASETPATCQKQGEITYTANAHLGVNDYTDSKTEYTDPAPHTPGEELQYNGAAHWYACEICGEKIKSANHSFGATETVKDATCTENGEGKVSCDCGYTKTVTIPATGEHTYVDGKCSGCGKEEGVCDHTELSYKIIRLEDYGCCKGTVVVLSCECGEVVTVDDPDSFYEFGCEFDETNESETEDEENGIYTEIEEGFCSVCGLHVYLKYTETEKDCKYSFELEAVLYKDGKTIARATKAEEEEYHDAEMAEIDLSDYGACGGTANVYQCVDCGKILALGEVYPSCVEVVEEEHKGEDGTMHASLTGSCDKCGFKVDMRMVQTKDGCNTSNTITYLLAVGDNVIVDIKTGYTWGNHETTEKYEPLGDSCIDGYKVIESCKNCDYTEEHIGLGHTSNSYGPQDLSTLIPCGGEAWGSKCEICGELFNIGEINPNCEVEWNWKENTDEQGIKHEYQYGSCNECGTVYFCDMWTVVESVCETSYYQELTVESADGEELISIRNAYGNSSHEWNEEYTLDGETCEDGWTSINTCTKCGEVDEWTGSGHRSDYEEIDLYESAGACGGWIDIEKCVICGETTHFNYHISCGIDYGKEPEIIKGDDGLNHYVYKNTCKKCGLTYIEESWQTEEVDCLYDSYSRLCIMRDTEVLHDYTLVYHNNSHKYEYTYELEGETCEDGYRMYGTCTKCGRTEQSWGKGHWTKSNIINLKEYGLCGGEIYENICIICNQVTSSQWGSLYCEHSHVETLEDGTEVWECKECESILHMLTVRSERDDNCRVTVTDYLKFYKNDECVFEHSIITYDEEHDYEISIEMKGESCEDGVRISYICKDCKMGIGSYVTSHHPIEKDRIDLTQYGACQGYISIGECPCGQITSAHLVDTCELNYVASDKEDKKNEVTRKCDICGLTVTETVTEKQDGCTVYNYTHMVVSIGDTVVYDYEYVTHTWSNHDYESTYEMMGETCDDGYWETRTCKVCGHTETFENYKHNTEYTHIYLEEHGLCGGWIEEETCVICKQVFNSNIDIYCDLQLVNSYDDGTEIYSCRNCQSMLRIVTTRSEKDENCAYTITRAYTFSTIKDGSILLEYTLVEPRYEHYFVYDFTLNGKTCTDGFYAHGVCKNCGQERNSYHEWHVLFEKERIDLEAYGACGGYISVGACACGQEQNAEHVSHCKMEYVPSDDKIENENRKVHKCSNCGLTTVETYYNEEDGCTTYNHVVVEYSIGDELIYVKDYVQSTSTNHQLERVYKLLGKTCEDGVEVTGTCKICGETETYTFYWHQTDVVESVYYTDHGACDGYYEKWECPCGEESFIEWSYGCASHMDHYTTTDDNKIQHYFDVWGCHECGLKITLEQYGIPDGCTTYNYDVLTIEINGTVILESEHPDGWSTNHVYDVSFELMGKTCKDGAWVYRTCKYCGAQETLEIYGHEEFLVASYEFSDYGACNGYLQMWACPCGERTSSNWSQGCAEYVGAEDGVHNYHCDKCGLHVTSTVNDVKDGCKIYHYEDIVVTVADVQIVKAYLAGGWSEDHNFTTSYEFLAESQNCEDGVRIIRYCSDCGHEESFEEYWHVTDVVETIDLSGHSECGGEILFWSCPCGQESGIDTCFDYDKGNYDTYEQDGIFYQVNTYTCSLCGLRYQDIYYTQRNPETCTVDCFHDISVTVDGNVVVATKYTTKGAEEHNYDVTVRLVEGATDCKDGVIETHRCLDCGYSYDTLYNYHHIITLNIFDLTNYGSTCGGYIEHVGCACGYEGEFRVICDDGCPFETTSSTEAVEDSVSGYADVYTYTCPVTDPACGFKIKIVEYYKPVPDSCMAYLVKNWYVGYDDATGEYKHLITENGNGREYTTTHIWKTTTTKEDYEGLVMTTNDTYCAKCQSHEVYRYFSDANGNIVREDYIRSYPNFEGADIKYSETIYEYSFYTNADGKKERYTSRHYVMTLARDNTKYERETKYERDYGYVSPDGLSGVKYTTTVMSTDPYENSYHESAVMFYNGHEYTVYEYSMKSAGTDNEYWYRYDYSYDFAGGCIMTTKWENSYGEIKEHTSTCHNYIWDREIPATCTQNGTIFYTCEVCGNGHEDTIYPNNHWWIYNENTGYYECGNCGLENANGASGDIVMEDLSDAWGNGENYVVGYWDQTEKFDFTYYVSIIPVGSDDTEGIYLKDITCTEHESLRAYVISIADVAAAAKELGYAEGEYEVKFTFSPYGADHNYDYSIIFN